MKQFLLVIISIFMITACACPSAIEVDSVQKHDKKLTCKDVVMEINEAEFFRKEARSKQYRRVEYMLNPLCYPSGYLSGSKGMRAADSRLDYLNNIYELLGCGQDIKNAPPKQTNIPPQASAAPVFQQGVPYAYGYQYRQQPQQYAPYGQQYYTNPVPYNNAKPNNLVQKTSIPQMQNRKTVPYIAMNDDKHSKKKSSYALNNRDISINNRDISIFHPVPMMKPVNDPEFKRLSLERTKEKMDGIALPFKVIPYKEEEKQTVLEILPLFPENEKGGEQCVAYQGCLGSL